MPAIVFSTDHHPRWIASPWPCLHCYFFSFIAAAPTAFDTRSATPRTYVGIIIFLSSLLTSAAGVWTTHNSSSPIFLTSSALLAVASAVHFFGALFATRYQKLSVLGANDIPTRLVKHGPYSWCRHPFYTSYIVNFWAVALLAPDSGLVWAAAIIIGLLYYSQARSEEAKFLDSKLDTEYEEYRRRTGMLLPRLY